MKSGSRSRGAVLAFLAAAAALLPGARTGTAPLTPSTSQSNSQQLDQQQRFQAQQDATRLARGFGTSADFAKSLLRSNGASRGPKGHRFRGKPWTCTAIEKRRARKRRYQLRARGRR
jgi:hypothetical protein